MFQQPRKMQALCLCLCLSVSVCLSVCLSLTHTHMHTHAHTHTCTHIHAHTCTYTLQPQVCTPPPGPLGGIVSTEPTWEGASEEQVKLLRDQGTWRFGEKEVSGHCFLRLNWNPGLLSVAKPKPEYEGETYFLPHSQGIFQWVDVVRDSFACTCRHTPAQATALKPCRVERQFSCNAQL